jgi:hypothetical protein
VPVEAPAPPAARETYQTPPHRPAHDLAPGAEIAVLTPELSTEPGRSRGMDVFRVDDDTLLTGVNPDPVK